MNLLTNFKKIRKLHKKNTLNMDDIMDLPERAGSEPVVVELKKGNTYSWCTCGLSAKQPFCDGLHRTTSFTPYVFIAEESKPVYLCMCKRTKAKPYCDGAHKMLNREKELH